MLAPATVCTERTRQGLPWVRATLTGVGRTTIARDLIELIQLGKADKAAILRSLDAAASGAERLRTGPPAVTVHFHNLRVNTAARAPVARGTRIDSTPVYERAGRAQLYALTDAARVDVVRFGRHPDQDIQVLDKTVSREHGLVIFAGELPLFCDYGTLKDGGHTGSMNGTYLDGVVRISDTMIPWLPGQELLFGTPHMVGGRRAFAIKLTYELHPEAFKPTTN
jgi:hypothetical protein